MPRSIRRLFASLCTSAMLLVVAASPAAAQNNSQQNGLVNVSVGDVNVLNDANIGVAAQVAANICGLKVGPVAVLGTAVDRTGNAQTVCTSNNQPVTITQA